MTLWCNHIPGPDDIFAAPDRETAVKRAAEHNAWLEEAYAMGLVEFSGYWPDRASGTMTVIEWPGSVTEHAADLARNVFAVMA